MWDNPQEVAAQILRVTTALDTEEQLPAAEVAE
jgi:hypothetical protein